MVEGCNNFGLVCDKCFLGSLMDSLRLLWLLCWRPSDLKLTEKLIQLIFVN